VQIFEKARIPSTAQPARPGGGFSIEGAIRTTISGEPRASFDAPSGKAVRKLPVSMISAFTGRPASSTSRRPSRQADRPSAGAGPSDARGTIAAAPSDAPASPAAPASRRRRVIALAGAVTISPADGWTGSGSGRSSTARPSPARPAANTIRASPSSTKPAPIASPISWVSPLSR
jgi:hypothetical protein